MPTLQQRFIWALTARGFHVIDGASRKALVFTKDGTGIYLWVGPAGSIRIAYGQRRKDHARPMPQKQRDLLLGTPIISNFYGA